MISNKLKINKVFNINKLISFHANEFDQNFIFYGEKHSDWEIVYIDKGCVEVKRDKELLILSQGDIIFHRPHEFHSIKSYNSSPNFFVIAFECNSPSMSCFDKFHTKLDKTQKNLLSSAIKEAENAYHIPKNTIEDDLFVKEDAVFGAEQLVKTYLEQLLILLARKKMNVQLKRHSLIDEQDNTEIVAKIKKYIEEHLCEKITNKDICNHVGYGKTYISILFHEESGFTLNEFINKQKLKKAKELIRTSNMNIAEISDYLSFDNPHYFCRVFKKFFGMTPSEFRKSLAIY
jgi:AraC-like DNA-binding protein